MAATLPFLQKVRNVIRGLVNIFDPNKSPGGPMPTLVTVLILIILAVIFKEDSAVIKVLIDKITSVIGQ